MTIEIKIPSPGESITEVELASWSVADGDYVKKDQELGEIESDKATLPLLAAEAGAIKILVEEGSTVEIGAIACTIDTSAEAPAEDKSESPKTESTEPKQEKAEIEKSASDSGAKSKKEVETKDGIKISPVAKSMMAEEGFSVDDIVNGLKHITSREVEAVKKAGITSSAPAATQTVNYERIEERAKMSNLRKKLSQRLVSVKNETAMLTTFNEVDMSKVKAFRAQFQERFQEQYGVKLGFMSFFSKAVAEAMKYHPLVNARIEGEEIVTPNYVDIAIAVSTPKGLMVPVIRDVNNKTLGQIEVDIAQMAEKARKGRLTIEEMSGGTFTITNGGVFGSLLSTPIINPPQSGILGMHNIVERPIAENGQVVIRPMMYTALSYDHRIIDGKDSVGFLVRLKEFIEAPEKMLVQL